MTELDTQYEYRAGSLVHAGMFIRSDKQAFKRIAWWPVEFKPTTVNMGLVVNEYVRTGEVVLIDRVRDILREDEE